MGGQLVVLAVSAGVFAVVEFTARTPSRTSTATFENPSREVSSTMRDLVAPELGDSLGDWGFLNPSCLAA
jgi:hypothetical protein